MYWYMVGVSLQCLAQDGSNPTKAFGFSVEGWCALKKEFDFCPSRRTSLNNAIYGNSSEFSHHHPPLLGPRTCMKTSYVLEMQHFLGYQIELN